MFKFLKKIFFFLVAGYIILYAIQYRHERSIRQAINSGFEKKYLKWTGIKEAKPDIVFLGSSRVYASINPAVFDSITHLKSFNMGTGSQSIIESYYILKEVTKLHKPKQVVLDLRVRYFENIDFYHAIENAKYMSGENKFNFIVKGLKGAGVANYCIPLIKHKGYITKATLFGKVEDVTASGVWQKGFKRSISRMNATDSLSLREKYNNWDEPAPKLPIANIEYLQKIKAFCDSEGIELLCIHLPFSPSSNWRINEGEFFATVCEKYNILFMHDFSSITYTAADFEDNVHQNIYGAQKTSVFLANYLN